ELKTTNGLTALTQPESAHSAVKAHIDALDDAQFTALQIAVPAVGSLILGLAFTNQNIDAKGIFDSARVEEHFKAEIYNEEKYGPDPAQEQKDKALLKDLEATEKFLKLLN
ncbi:MAG: ATP12 chaperone family protein, partial [Pseudomonadota bacterium]